MLKRWNKRCWTGMGVILALAGCTFVTDMVGYDTVALDGDAAESYSQIIQNARDQEASGVSSPTAQRVQRAFARLRPHTERANKTDVPLNWQMNVIRSDGMSAWVMSGGRMAVYTGTVEKLKLTGDEIAAAVGHEMAHALLEHSKGALGEQVLTGLGGSISASPTGVNGNLVGLSADLLATKSFSRHQESETDAGGVHLAAEADHDPEAAVSVWGKMNKVQGSSPLSILSAHPTSQARISAIREMLPEVMPTYQENKR